MSAVNMASTGQAQAVAQDDVLSCFNVVDLTSTCAGAYAGRLLAEAGLSVLRIETSQTDLLRKLPPFLPDGSSMAWWSAHGKKAVVRVDAGRAQGLIARLAAAADVVITDQSVWREVAARDVNCHIDPIDGLLEAECAAAAEMATTDVLTQARSGAVSVTGRLTGPPVPIGFPVGDVAPGIYATIAVLDALIKGGRQRIAIGGLDATLSLLSYFATCYKVDGEDIGFVGSGHPYIVPYGAFPAADGWVIVAAFTQVFWRKLCSMLERPEWTDNPRFRNFSLRRENREELNGLIADAFRTQPVAHWLDQLRAADVPHAPVYTLHQALHHPVVNVRGMTIEVEGHRLLGSPVIDLCRRALGQPDRPVPMRDWRRCMRALGVGDSEWAGLASSVGLVPITSPA